MSADNRTNPKKRRVFRWRGMIAVAVFSVLLTGWLLVFGEPTVESVIEEASTQSLGTQVDIDRLRINVFRTTLELSGITIADPFDNTRNLVDARSARLELELEPLLQKKIVVRSFSLDGVQSGTARATPARPVDTTGFAPRALREIRRFRDAIDVPLLSLTPIDTIRAIVLDPTQLRSVQSAIALEQRADSLQTSVTARAAALIRNDVVDSAQSLVVRLKDQTARSLGIVGAANAIVSVRRLATRVDSLKRAADGFQRDVRGALDSLAAGVRAIDDSRRADYDFARGLLALPKFDAPNIGPSLFGQVSISAFEKGLYWVELAREHAPPGLRPREKQGPKRLRSPGTNIQFVRPQSYPNFLLRNGEISLTLGDATGAARGEYALAVSDVTTEPSLTGRPMQFALRRTAAASDVRTIEVEASLDHTGSTMRDMADVRAGEIKLPQIALPGIPVQVDLGRGASLLHLALDGDSLSARWSIESSNPRWSLDSTRAASLNSLERLVARVLTGLGAVRVDAELRGTLSHPILSVRSNLDNQIASSIRSVAGEEVARMEQRVRAQVDSVVDARAAPARARVTEIRSEIDARLKEVTVKIDSLRSDLAARLRAMGG